MPPINASFVPQVSVSLDAPTLAGLQAEAAALGDHFSEVTAHPGDLVADAEEILTAKADLADLIARKFKVSQGLLTRIELLTKQLAPYVAELQRLATAATLNTAEADKARVRLLEIRTLLAALGKAAGLPADLFALESRKSDRLNVVMMRMDVVLENVALYKEHLPDTARVDALMVEARAVMDAQKTARRGARLMRTDRTQGSLQQERWERLLLDAMQYLSAQGLAAYPGDATREARYRLDHVYGRAKSAVADPGAGGATGVPQDPA